MGSDDRRGFLADSLKAMAQFFAEIVYPEVEEKLIRQRYLRPPGALDEAAFLLSCTRCGECAKACPTNVIKLLGPSAGVAVGTPYIDPLDNPCDLCGKCMPVCEPKALLQIEDPRKVKIGTAVIDPNLCWAHLGQPCDLCYQRCPYPDEAIRMVDGKPEILADACTGCGQCVYVCVASPVAITIEPRK
ncbi:MAG TPA: 4Fe-4S dicluster domain-containing protein [Symbiobacteriaceae bacterium]|nr:4Fe-4S dicluster domain-containing protein [Symbiobacteriaceae bacterium]